MPQNIRTIQNCYGSVRSRVRWRTEDLWLGGGKEGELPGLLATAGRPGKTGLLGRANDFSKLAGGRELKSVKQRTKKSGEFPNL
jgi:hypothetical protein